MGLFHQHKKYQTSAQDAQEARIEDAAYMLNHAIACTFTDLFEAQINSAFHNKLVFHLPKKIQPYLANFKVGCGCSGRHSLDNHSDHHVEANATYLKSLGAELIADFGSVPIVLAAQRYAPNQMKMIERAIEPIVGEAFHKRAEISAKIWAKNRGISYDSQAYKQEVEDIYRHEISHLPQAILWTGTSLGIHAVGQKALGINAPWLGVISAKLASSAIIFTGVVGARFAAPSTMRKLDKFTTKHFIGPSTIAAGDVLGLDSNVVRNFVEREEREIAQEAAFEKLEQGKTLDAQDVAAIKQAKQEGQQLIQQEKLHKSMQPDVTVNMPTIEAHQSFEHMQQAN